MSLFIKKHYKKLAEVLEVEEKTQCHRPAQLRK